MNNSECEIPFWKVIHNKFLLNLIFQHISTYECELHFTKYGQYNLKYRNKFKNITSLNEMIKNKQWELLKCKLSCDQETIDIDTDGISQLMELGVNNKNNNNDNEKTENQINDEKTILVQLLNQLSINIKCLDQIINLPISPIQLAIEKDNIFAIDQLLSNKQLSSSLSINESTIENSIKNHRSFNIDTLKWLIGNYKHVISKNCKKKLLSLSFSNLIHQTTREQIIDLIVDEQLYNENDDQVEKIDGANLLSIASESTLLKLNGLLNYFYFKKQLTNILYKDLTNGVLSVVSNPIYEIYKYYSIYSRKNYESFLYKYQEIIFGNDLSIVINFIIYTYNTKLLQQLLSSNLKSIYRELQNFNDYKPLNQFSRPEYPSIEFVEIILKNYKNFQNQTLILSIYKCISNYPFNNDGGKEYSELISKLSEFNTWKDYFPITYNPILKSMDSLNIIIQDVETVDWLYGNVEKYVILKNKFHHFKTGDAIQFKSFDIIQYAMNKFGTIPLLSFKQDVHQDTFKQLFYKSLYIDAINQCDLKSIQQIDESLIYIDFQFSIYHSPFEYHHGQTIENLNNLTNYLVSTNYKHFSSNLFKFFIEYFVHGSSIDVSSVCFGLGNIIDSADISRRFFLRSLLVPSKKFQIFFNQQSFNPITEDLFEHSYTTNYNDPNIALFYCFPGSIDPIQLNFSNFKFIDLFDCIKIIINNTSKQHYNTIIASLTTILNYFFTKSLQSNDINFVQLVEIFNLITDYDIEIKHSLFHSFFYIYKKSSKLFKYLIEFPFVVDDNDGSYKLKDQIDISVFTFENIKSNSFDWLLRELVKQLSIGLSNVQTNLALDYNLSYYLEICRIDLFLIQLDKIELKFKNDDGSFNYSKKLFNNCNNLLNENQLNRFISIFQ